MTVPNQPEAARHHPTLCQVMADVPTTRRVLKPARISGNPKPPCTPWKTRASSAPTKRRPEDGQQQGSPHYTKGPDPVPHSRALGAYSLPSSPIFQSQRVAPKLCPASTACFFSLSKPHVLTDTVLRSWQWIYFMTTSAATTDNPLSASQRLLTT